MAAAGLDVDEIIETLKQRKLPSEPQIKELCDKATAILGEEDNVQVVQAPVTICGDLHGEQPFAAAVGEPEALTALGEGRVGRGAPQPQPKALAVT